MREDEKFRLRLWVLQRRVDYLREQSQGIIDTEESQGDETSRLRVALSRDVLAVLDGRRDKFVFIEPQGGDDAGGAS